MINDAILNDMAAEYAEEILREVREHGGEAYDLAHQYADGSQWVIYYSKAHQLCQNCDTQIGEEAVSDCGEPEGGWSYDGFACAIAYHELCGRILCAIEAQQNAEAA
jgi:hypothetical protein